MNGAGNDFILLDAIAEPFDESAASALARSLCDRRRSDRRRRPDARDTGGGRCGLPHAVLQFRRLARRNVRQRRTVHLPVRLCTRLCRPRTARGDDRRTRDRLAHHGRAVPHPAQHAVRCGAGKAAGLRTAGHIGAATWNLEAPASRIWRWRSPRWQNRSEDALRRLGRALRYHPALPKGANVNFYELTGPDETPGKDIRARRRGLYARLRHRHRLGRGSADASWAESAAKTSASAWTAAS